VLFVYFDMEFVHIGFKRQAFAIGIIAFVRSLRLVVRVEQRY